MTVNIAPDLTALPVTSWATTGQFVINSPYATCPDPVDYISPWTTQYWLDLSTSILFHLTGRRFPGARTVTVTPAVVCGCNSRLSPWIRSWDRLQGSLIDCGLPCSSCGNYPVLDLGGNVSTVTSVTINGVALSNSLYRVDDHRWLVRLADTDGTNPGWTVSGQRYDVLSGTGTFVVVYTSGLAPPVGGDLACVHLAAALRQMGDGPVDIGVLANQTLTTHITQTQVTPRGAQQQLNGFMKSLRQGKSGLGPVDAFLAVWLVATEDDNGNNIAPVSICWTPDTDDAAPKRTTWVA